MKNNKLEIAIIAYALLLITTIGTVLTFAIPPVTSPHYLFWIAVAVAAAWGATKLRFRQWLLMSGFIGAAGIVMILAAHAQPLREGSHRFLCVGKFAFDTYVPFIAICALVLAAIRRKSRMTTTTLLISVLIAAMAFTGWKIAEHPMRRARVAAFFTEDASSVVLTPQEQERNKNYETLKECFWDSKTSYGLSKGVFSTFSWYRSPDVDNSCGFLLDGLFDGVLAA